MKVYVFEREVGVILSEAKNLDTEHVLDFEILRFAQDDKQLRTVIACSCGSS